MPADGPVKLPPLETGDHLDQPTFHARYEAMPPDTRAQLIGGVVYVRGRVTAAHGSAHAELVYWTGTYLLHTAGLTAASGGTVLLGPDSEVEPDVAVRIDPGGQTRVSADDYVVGCPELVGEVANGSANIELHAKLRDYERYGAKEYVVALLRECRVIWFARERGRLVEVPTDADGIYRSRLFPGLSLDPEALLRGDVRRLAEVANQGQLTPEHAAFAASLTRRSATASILKPPPGRWPPGVHPAAIARPAASSGRPLGHWSSSGHVPHRGLRA